MSIVQEALLAELRDRIEQSRTYADIIKTAKTQPKKQIFKKKLRKNNQIVAKLLKQLDTLNKKNNNNDEQISGE